MKKNIWLYYLFVFLRDFLFFSAVLVPFYIQWGRIDQTKIQILQSWFMFWLFLLEVPTGAVADYFGRKYSLALGALIFGLGVFIYGSIPKFEIFLLGEFLAAAGAALVSGADEALLYDTLKQLGKENESQKFFGQAESIHLMAILTAAPIGGIIASSFGLNFPMKFSSIPLFAAAFIILAAKEPRIEKAQSESRRYLEIFKKGLNFLYEKRRLRLLAFNAILVDAAAYFLIWLYQPLLQKVNFPIVYFGFVHAVLTLAEILVSSNFVRLEKLFGSSKKYLKTTAWITSVFFVLVALFPIKVVIFLFIIFAGGFGLTRMTYVSARMQEFIPSAERATIISSVSMFRRFALMLLNPIVGLAATKSLPATLFALGLLPLITFLPVFQRTEE
jgi:MFS family permease